MDEYIDNSLTFETKDTWKCDQNKDYLEADDGRLLSTDSVQSQLDSSNGVVTPGGRVWGFRQKIYGMASKLQKTLTLF